MIPVKHEAWLARRLWDHGVRDVFAGITTPEVRLERMRSAILSNNLADVIVGNRDGKPETYGECFARLYSTKLHEGRAAHKADPREQTHEDLPAPVVAERSR